MCVENSGKPLGGRGSDPNFTGGAHIAHQDPLAGREGGCCPSQEPQPAHNLGSFGLGPNEKSWARHCFRNTSNDSELWVFVLMGKLGRSVPVKILEGDRVAAAFALCFSCVNLAWLSTLLLNLTRACVRIDYVR